MSVLGIAEQVSLSRTVDPASIPAAGHHSALSVTAAGILVAAAVGILVRASAAVTVLWDNRGSRSLCRLHLGQANREHKLHVLLVTQQGSKVINAAPKRVCLPEGIRADQLSPATSPRWFEHNTGHEDADQPLDGREEAFLRPALPPWAPVGLTCEERFKDLKIQSLFQ